MIHAVGALSGILGMFFLVEARNLFDELSTDLPAFILAGATVVAFLPCRPCDRVGARMTSARNVAMLALVVVMVAIAFAVLSPGAEATGEGMYLVEEPVAGVIPQSGTRLYFRARGLDASKFYQLEAEFKVWGGTVSSLGAISGWDGQCGNEKALSQWFSASTEVEWGVSVRACDDRGAGITTIEGEIRERSSGPQTSVGIYPHTFVYQGTLASIELEPPFVALPDVSLQQPMDDIAIHGMIRDAGLSVGSLLGVPVGTALAIVTLILAVVGAAIVAKKSCDIKTGIIGGMVVILALATVGMFPVWAVFGMGVFSAMAIGFVLYSGSASGSGA